MFLRMTITGRDADSHQPQGIFHAAWNLLDSGDLTDAEAEDLRSLLKWFDTYMPCPTESQCRALSHRAVFWFRPTAQEFIGRAWEIVQLLRLHGYLVEVHKTRDPGRVLYHDPYQVAAIFQRR
jgi:hypothetical protein